MDPNMKRSIILDNYQDARNRGIPSEEGYIKINSNNESCIDEINLMVKLENNIIRDVRFDGEACAISTSATSIMIKMFLGKKIEEALKIIEHYNKMIEEIKGTDREM